MNTIIPILKKYLITSRHDLEGKWWHMFIKILIYGSTIIIFLIILIMISGVSYLKYKYIDYSANTNKVLYVNSQEIIVECGYKPSFLYNCPQYSNNILNELELKKFLKEDYSNLINNYPTLHNIGLVINLKLRPVPLLGSLALHILYLFLFPLVWFLFLDSVVYRAIVYIIYGKK